MTLSIRGIDEEIIVIGESTAMSEALIEAGIVDETPKQAAKRIWQDTKKERQHPYGGNPFVGDPIETMRLFSEWARESPERMMLLITPRLWNRVVRSFLERGKRTNGWAHGSAFCQSLLKLNKAADSRSATVRGQKRRSKFTEDEALQDRSIKSQSSRRAKARKATGIKMVRAEVDVVTGEIIALIDKEYGPFAHIRINGLHLAEITTEQALHYCDIKATDNAFVRALCHLIPNPNKTIGEQWTVEMIREAKKVAHAGPTQAGPIHRSFKASEAVFREEGN